LLVICLVLMSMIAGRAEPESALLAEAQAALKARDGAAAERLYNQLTALAPANLNYLKGLADAQTLQDKYADAAATYETAITRALAAGDAIRALRRASCSPSRVGPM
jgi:Flp pilus assembly protein TadD